MSRSLIFLLLILFCIQLKAQTSADEVLANQYYQGGEYEKALSLYQKLFEKFHDQSYYDQYFSALLKLKKYDYADKLLKKLLKSDPENPVVQVDYGRLLQERGDQEKAKEWYNKLIKDLPKSEFAIRELATSLYRAEAYDYSIKTLLAGRELLNDESLFTFDLISLYRYQKNKEMLIQEFLTALSKNPEAVMQAKNMLSGILEGNEDYDILKRLLLSKLQKNPQNVAYADLLIWAFLQKKEFDLALKQTIALDKRLKEDGMRVYDLVYTLISNKAYSTAVDALNYVVEKGKDNAFYIPARIQLLNTKNQILINGSFKEKDLLQLEREYQSLLTEFREGVNTVFAMRQLANLQAFYLNRPKDAAKLLESVLKIPNLSSSIIGQAKLELGDIYILTGEVWEATLIYGQVEKEFANEPLGQEAKFRNAKLSYYQGDFTWAKAQLDVLKSSTSQLIANDALNLSLVIAENTAVPADTNTLKVYARAELLSFKKQYAKALSTLDSINQKFPGNSLSDDVLMSKAKIFLQQNKFTLAAEQFQQIISDYSFDLWADDAIYMLADLNETQLNNKSKAQELYQKLITDFPGSLYVSEARKHFRALRGDKLD